MIKKFVVFLKDVKNWKEEYYGILLDIEWKCEICKLFVRIFLRLVVVLFLVIAFNEKVVMDLKKWNDKWILYIIDMWFWYIVFVFISRKKLNEVIDVLMRNWIGVFGVMGVIFIDNGGEFSLDEMREVMFIFNVRICIIVGMSFF